MRTRTALRTILTSAALGTLSLVPQTTWAQLDTNPPLPNVLLLVDTSGSMEYMVSPDVSTGLPRLPTCNVASPASTNEQNRWVTLLSVLTGEFQNYSCESEARNTTDFINEYSVSGVSPYDGTYYLPHVRPTSNGCQVGPNPVAWPDPTTSNVYTYTQAPHCKPSDTFGICKSPFREHTYNSLTTSCTTAFAQNEDGLLDAFKDRARFGLMTFDADPLPGTGKGAGSAINSAKPFEGMWSYYNGWNNNATGFAWGRPGGCSTSQTMEVGGRNPSAPPWEGRLIPFGDFTASEAENLAQNARIQDALLAMRPYGATPTNGMLADAEYFLTADTSPDPQDPTNSAKYFGPSTDPLVAGKCRSNFVILLTDGEPNLDMRPECTAAGTDSTNTGKCPYPDTSDTIVTRLKQNGIETFVVGFAVSTNGPSGPTQVKCDALNSSSQFDTANKCTAASIAANPQLKPCCELAKIAFAGGTVNAQFADNKDQLRVALNTILSSVASKSTSRTAPAFASAGSSASGGSSSSSQAPASSYQFLSSFYVNVGALWSGVLERQRYVCEADNGVMTPKLKAVDASKGDSFSTNLNTAAVGTRLISTFMPSTAAEQLLMTRTLRKTPANDGLGSRSGTQKQGDPATFLSYVTPESLNVLAGAASTSTCSTSVSTITAASCRDRIVKWELGLVPDPDPSTGVVFSRAGNVFGSIYHSTPTVVPPPNDFVRDESYTAFAGTTGIKDRPLMLYTATTDGQLHGFKVAASSASDSNQVDTQANNELWSFLPPAVLPGLRTLFPGVQKNLLDGAPVVRDVVFSRNKNQASFDPSSTSAGWNTVLVSGFGPTLGGYYALDVTHPVPTSTSGPQFLWQLTTAEDSTKTVPLFGKTSTTPAIATIYYDDGTDKREIAVAILPGGDGDVLPGECDRDLNAGALVDPAYPPRSKIRCYGAADPSLSVTIVRLDTGEVLKTFRTQAGMDALPADLKARSLLAKFDSPIVGAPVAYPSGTGVLSNRIFVGDRDGGMWRIDLSSPSPSQWTASLFFDGFSSTDFATTSATAGQPVRTPPVLSVDTAGNVVLIYSTGDQDQITGTLGMQNALWSLREDPVIGGTTIKSKANWHLGFNEVYSGGSPTGTTTQWNGGERVTGPLSLFNGTVYFSTFRPQATGQLSCTGGSSTLWGVDYLERTDSPRTAPPKGRLILDPSGTLPTTAPPAVSMGDSIIFGVGLSRTPSCFTETNYFDAYFGQSSANALTDVNPGTFQLVVQTGSSGTPSTGSQTNAKVFKLPTPPAAVRVDSWATVVE